MAIPRNLIDEINEKDRHRCVGQPLRQFNQTW